MTRIMLAEDDLTMVALLKTLLGMEGYQVIALNPNDNVYESALKDQPDVLLLDIHLPQDNGLDILDRLRQDEKTKTLKVIMTSGLNLENECISHGANDFLLKPFMPDDLLSILKQTLNPS
ncbi:MAG: response regulator [Anaerolineae bacterium]|nr:response regulator [Anaerolineae bacterium]MDK1117187.1 response regulator [Anaerolineae bacterium]